MAVDWTPIFENLKEELKKLRERDRKCDMERLTERNKEGKAITKTLEFQYLIDKLAEYEQAEENRVLIRVPHPVGTEVYFAFKLQGVKKDYIRRWQYNNKGLMFYSHGSAYSVDAIGKTVFLTKAEAEQALAKMKGE